MNGYIFFYSDKRVEIRAETLYADKLKAIEHFKPPKSKQHTAHGALAELGGAAVTHVADF